ncbi:adaptor related protein complex 3 subunit beta 2 [Homo sapiens]|uniref:Isoform 3 of AP-3 complex subunit beta-2 n=1 Tax=Homo sapiens TaxID=9606 RepID=Q13367-3|nr:AP-3 complex subunit beta-2 isoform 3 [Homo sapiens]AAI43343.1 AP3B2 protein [Homo sapiens]KAI2575598.1 adaptor related protein complex 3 subunit beta 2 [Homo sapiens]KAI4059209.1 adaptor related protein complex 3 subunit beta 2 [Homo sapiens]|eukprot:NP_001265440.1 AP-3 complex subunit beta-2 isoform 3 [Homo sapiens]
MSAAPAYSEDKGGSAGPGEPEYGHDPASGGIFSSDYKRHDDLKEMLDTNKDSLKLEAMKRIVAMIARGKNASDLFPAVVKNVACKNIEDPNQLIRASALRVLSSIRVPIIVPIMMLAIKEAASDMSPYVRKTAAHAIPKLYSLDSDQKDQLIEVIEKLLADKTTLVAGSVVMAFEEVCPERIDLIHKNYRKLCNLLIDVEEWGQVVIISMLTRYARTQFLSPTQNESLLEENAEKAFYGSEEDEAKGAGSEETAAAAAPSRKPYVMDPDHRLLLRNTKPLLQSRSAAVVMAVAQLYFHLAPKAEVGVIAKALVRLLRSHSEVQYVVLQNVATMSIKRRGMFEPYLKSFYIRSTDPTQIKILKLEVLTNLANETNIPTVLREFQTYIRSMDKDFVAATIQAIGRCATNIGRVRDTCLNGLVQLLSNRDELVVAESVVVIKKLLQMQPAQHGEIIKHLAKLTDNIQVPMARASILWLIGEYCEHVPRIAPDVLRKMAKSFTAEEDIVKLQVINLAAKLYLTNSKQTKLLTQYVLSLAKYDQNYDIRDRARFTRQLIVPSEQGGALSRHAKKLFLAPKPAPVLESSFKDRDHFQLGSLSHLLNAKATGYQELPDWPEEAPDPSVRNVEVPEWTKCSNREKRKEKEKPFYSDSEGESGPTESADSDPESESESDSKSSSESGSGESSSESDNEDQDEDEEKGRGSESEQSEEDGKRKTKKKVPERKGEASSSDEGSDSSSSSSESEMTSESEEEQLEPASWSRKTPPSSKSAPATKEISLLDLEDFTPPSVQPVSPPAIVSTSLAADLEGLTLTDSTLVPSLLSPVSGVGRQELLHRVAGEGLAVDYTFSRQPFSGDPHMVSVHIHFSNSSDTPIKGLHVGTPKLPAGISIQEFPEIESLAPGESATAVMGINFCDSTQAANFQLCTQTRQFYVSIQPPVGELMAPVFMSENEFKKEQGKLMGMNEITEKLMLPDTCRSDHIVVQKVTATANLGRVPCGTSDEYRFAGRTLTGGSLVLLTLDARPAGAAQLTVNSEKMVIGTMLVKDVIQALTQ